jgi:hypothetical protein
MDKDVSLERTIKAGWVLRQKLNYPIHNLFIIMPKSNGFSKLLTLFIGAVVIVSVWATSASGQAQLTERSKLALDGIGPIRIGMTVNEASRSAGVRLIKTKGGGDRTGRTEPCASFEVQGGPKGIDFIARDGRIISVYISNERVTTMKGIKIGDPEGKVFSLYPRQIQATPHPYSSRPPYNGKYLTFVPRDAADKNYRIIFETIKGHVERFRSGQLPEVEYIEGCS